MEMATTAEELFADTVRALPPTERLRLAALILEDLAQPHLSIVDISDSWSEQDMRDLTTFSLRYADALYPEEDELV